MRRHPDRNVENLLMGAARAGLCALLLQMGGAYAATPADEEREAVSVYAAAEYERARPLLIRAAASGSALAARYLGNIYWNGEGVVSDLAEATRWYRRAADGGDLESQFRMASMLSAGVGVKQNASEALEWAKRAGDRGHTAALEFVADTYWFGRGVDVDNDAALTIYRRLLPFGSLVARERLGDAYLYGFGVAVNVSEALRYHREAASGKHVPSYYKLGLLYETRVKGAPDWTEAFRWYERSADAKNPDACLRIGRLYYEGGAVKQDIRSARRYLECAIEGGKIPEAVFFLGVISTKFPTGAPNYAEAMRQFQRCADAGFSPCIRNIGLLYYGGDGVKRDQRRAREYLKRAAELHDEHAAQFLGLMHELGQGGLQDYSEAAHWYWRAAELGNADGQWALGRLYETGRGVEQSLVEAYKWINIATATTDDDDDRTAWAKDRDRIAGEMSSADRAEAQRMARAWRPMTPIELAKRLADDTSSGASTEVEAPTAPSTQASTPSGNGTGFWVSGDGHVLTAKHVIAECSEVHVVDGGVDRGTATIVGQDPKADVAILKANVRPTQFGVFRQSSARQGEEVVVYGFPLGSALSASGVSTSGTISALAGLANDPSLLQISAPVQPGNSGGPLVDTAGNVLGIVVAKLDALKVAKVIGDVPQNVNFAVKSSVALNLMDALSVPYSMMAPDVRLANADLTQKARGISVRVDCYK